MATDCTSDPPPVMASLDDEDQPEPPTPHRVARRALALAAVIARGLVEQEDASDPMVEVHRKKVLEWIDALDFGDELESDEWKVLQRPVGTLDRQAAVNATWRIEGLGVLAWALSRFELPPYDQMVDPGVLLGSVGFLDEFSLDPAAVRTETPLGR